MSSLTLERQPKPTSLRVPRRTAPGRATTPSSRTRTGEQGRSARTDRTATPRPEAHDLVRRLYAEHGSALQAYVTRLLSDPHQAEDVVQETMMRAWRNAEILVPERGSVNGWLMRVAHNIAVDKIRARKARPDTLEETATGPRTLDDHAAGVVDSVFVDRTLARLSPAHSEVLRAVYFSDRTAAQAAEELGLPVGTVKSRTYHALRRLKEFLGEELDGEFAGVSHSSR
ncbi:MAG: sigma-70 family RNA polymerase sigma factor [Actinoallomurus sp.]